MKPVNDRPWERPLERVGNNLLVLGVLMLIVAALLTFGIDDEDLLEDSENLVATTVMVSTAPLLWTFGAIASVVGASLKMWER